MHVGRTNNGTNRYGGKNMNIRKSHLIYISRARKSEVQGVLGEQQGRELTHRERNNWKSFHNPYTFK